MSNIALRRERDELARTAAELSERFEEKVEELSLVRQVGDALGTSLDLQTLCGRTVDLVLEAVSAESCSLMLVDGEGRDEGGLVLAAVRGAFDEVPTVFEVDAEAPRFDVGEGVAGAVVRESRTIRIGDTRADPRFAPPPTGGDAPLSLLCLPLIARDRVIGVMNLSDSIPDAYEDRHERLLTIVANSVAMAISNARLFGEVSRSRERLANENRTLRRALSAGRGEVDMIGSSAAFRAVLQRVSKVADTSANVLITGDSGTGKELIARSIHVQSARRDASFVAINCAALPEALLEAELFGIERGVATGVDARAGTFERAQGGTLFLDEIGDMSSSVQAKVLRVIQERHVTRVGGQGSKPVDVRLVAATHQNLEAGIREGRFREDLYYRLRVVQVHVPPLRERREDILPLARYFLARYAARYGRPERRLSRSAARALLDHGWPGNVRELEHTIEQAVLIADGDEIEPLDLGLTETAVSGIRVELPESFDDLPTILGEVQRITERRLIERALADCGGNRTRAARTLGLARRTLLYKLQRLELS